MRFDAAVAHARRCGTRNAPGMLAWIIRGHWGVLTQRDEDRARRPAPRPRPGPPTPVAASASPYRQPPPPREPTALAGLLEKFRRGREIPIPLPDSPILPG